MLIFGVIEISDNIEKHCVSLTDLNELGQITGKQKSFPLALDHPGGRIGGILATSSWESQRKLSKI